MSGSLKSKFGPLVICVTFILASIFLCLSNFTRVLAQNSELISLFQIPTVLISGNNYYVTAGSDGNVWFTEVLQNKISKISPLGIIQQFDLPTSNSFPQSIVAGSDGNIWFAEVGRAQIGKITPEGIITEFFVGHNVGNLILGSDGNVWFTAAKVKAVSVEDFIGRITPQGDISETFLGEIGLSNILNGSDGNIWFVGSFSNEIGKISPSGEITKYPLPTNGDHPTHLRVGPNNDFWYVKGTANKIGRITTDGGITEFMIPFPMDSISDMTTGADGNLWFTLSGPGKIGRITPSGVVSDFIMPTFSFPNEIEAGSDGNLWVLENGKIGRVTLQGLITEYVGPSGTSANLIKGPDGNLWFADFSGNRIGRINNANISGPSPTPSDYPCVITGFGDSNDNPLRQEDNQWKNLPYGGNYFTRSNGSRVFLPFKYYGNNKDTIGAWGCKTTSAAMIVNYYARQQKVRDPATGIVFQTNPQKLNAWLQQNNGYYSGHALPVGNPTYWDSAFLDLGAVVKYAKNNGVNISNNGTLRKKGSENNTQFISRTKDTLNGSMCAFNPAILAVNNSGHFIDASGKTVDNAVETWQIHDPMWNGNPPGISTLKAKYSNTYNQIDLISGNLPTRHLTFTKYSPVEMYVTDPEGKRVGLNASTNTSYDEIPDASFGTEFLGADDGGGGLIQAGMLDIVDPKQGEYTLTVIGTGSGSYGLEVRQSDEDASFTSSKISATTTPGQTNTYLVTPTEDPATPVVLQKKVVLKILPNKVYPQGGILAAVILGEANFDVKNIDPVLVKLGEGEAKPLLGKGFLIDINKDNKKDLLLFFKTKQAGLNSGDTQLCLAGINKPELSFKGCDSITVSQGLPPLLLTIINLLGNVDIQELLKIRQFIDSIK